MNKVVLQKKVQHTTTYIWRQTVTFLLYAFCVCFCLNERYKSYELYQWSLWILFFFPSTDNFRKVEEGTYLLERQFMKQMSQVWNILLNDTLVHIYGLCLSFHTTTDHGYMSISQMLFVRKLCFMLDFMVKEVSAVNFMALGRVCMSCNNFTTTFVAWNDSVRGCDCSRTGIVALVNVLGAYFNCRSKLLGNSWFLLLMNELIFCKKRPYRTATLPPLAAKACYGEYGKNHRSADFALSELQVAASVIEVSVLRWWVAGKGTIVLSEGNCTGF